MCHLPPPPRTSHVYIRSHDVTQNVTDLLSTEKAAPLFQVSGVHMHHCCLCTCSIVLGVPALLQTNPATNLLHNLPYHTLTVPNMSCHHHRQLFTCPWGHRTAICMRHCRHSCIVLTALQPARVAGVSGSYRLYLSS